MRTIKFEVNDKEYGYHSISTIDKPKQSRGAHNFKGYMITTGYVLRKVEGHPNANSRGYYLEHRLVVEENLKRLLRKGEVVHHIDGNRRNNKISNLKVVTQSEHAGIEMRGKRNPNGTMTSKEPIFDEIKFRLYDSDRDLTSIYTLSQLIGKTFRRGKFQFRGRFTGLLDKNGKEIYEGDILLQKTTEHFKQFNDAVWEKTYIVNFGKKDWDEGRAGYKTIGFYLKRIGGNHCIGINQFDLIDPNYPFEVIGDIYSTPNLLTNE